MVSTLLLLDRSLFPISWQSVVLPEVFGVPVTYAPMQDTVRGCEPGIFLERSAGKRKVRELVCDERERFCEEVSLVLQCVTKCEKIWTFG